MARNRPASFRITMAKRTALLLLGNKDVDGKSLIGKIPDTLLDFLTRLDTDPKAAYEKYRSILKEHFPDKFFELEI